MKQFTILIAIVAALAVLQGTQAKTFTECELARLLRSQFGFDKSKVNNFVCLAKAESSLSTTATHKNSNGSTDYGLFQINNKYWCSTPGYKSAGNDCNIQCSDLLSDDITKAVKCANLIYRRQGYSAWYGWKAKCQSGVKDLSSC
ncbi:lysozyme-like [Malaya genurostris]|uniref:lysozyme-like n=1 Tax=Malaya genurostris TaxID=325434 RepID=UPI0026F3D98A|nr:lysozyme-like [Malaya genurostris]